MLKTSEFWVVVSFVGFVAILVYYKVPALIAKALDDRAAAIRKELDEELLSRPFQVRTPPLLAFLGRGID